MTTNTHKNIHIPWTELYRPTHLNDIVLDTYNKKILNNIVETGHFPNLLFYGPPGTGKTTTIVNLIQSYQDKHFINNNINGSIVDSRQRLELVIHLNASDERGIDVIRTQINAFANSKSLFAHGMKFVILDEVDYMTKTAQQALRYLMQNYGQTIRFCLICNYISKIDEGLQNEFIRLRFNQLPPEDIIAFLQKIVHQEHLSFSPSALIHIQKMYKSDIRCMVNFLQSNQSIGHEMQIMNDQVWQELLDKLLHSTGKDSTNDIQHFIYSTSMQYNMDKKNIIKDFFQYILQTYTSKLTSEFIDFAEFCIHQSQYDDTFMRYFINHFPLVFTLH